PSRQRVGLGKTIDERTKTNALHYATNSNGTGSRHVLFQLHNAAATLPTNLDHFAVLNQHRHSARALSKSSQARARLAIRFDVIFLELAPPPLQPSPHLLGVGTTGGAIKFKLGHDRAPPTIPG